MVTDHQVRKLMKQIARGEPLETAGLKAGMCENTARKYRDASAPPSERRASQPPRPGRTREDPFAEVWTELVPLLEINPGLQALTLFQELQRRYPGRFQDGQRRTLQRKVKAWRALAGPAKEVMFPQEHFPGELGASDFCHLTGLHVTLQGRPFAHLLYHFVLSYSNWETGSLCFSESFESLSAGLQAALWELGGAPKRHRTDSLSAAVQPLDGKEGFTRRYHALLSHYGMQGEAIQPGKAHENGDVEQRHHRFRLALDQALMLRGSRDFESREEYLRFVRELLAQLNSGRRERLREELAVLRSLPAVRLDVCRKLKVSVGPSSTVRVLNNTYSVPSRLIGETVEVRVDAEYLELWYAQRCVERLPRIRGQYQHRIHYRHVIDWLVRKPGAFAHYRYREDLFPTSRFRMAYDALHRERPGNPGEADREYLALLFLAAQESEQGVDDALRLLLASAAPLRKEAVQELLASGRALPPATEVAIAPVNLASYDVLLPGLAQWEAA
jgi:hypothetical protein